MNYCRQTCFTISTRDLGEKYLRALAVNERTDVKDCSTVRTDTIKANPVEIRLIKSLISVSFLTAELTAVLKKPDPDDVSARKYSFPTGAVNTHKVNRSTVLSSNPLQFQHVRNNQIQDITKSTHQPSPRMPQFLPHLPARRSPGESRVLRRARCAAGSRSYGSRPGRAC